MAYIREYPWGAAPGWKLSWVTHDFGSCYSFGMIRTEKEKMVFRDFFRALSELFRDVAKI